MSSVPIIVPKPRTAKGAAIMCIIFGIIIVVFALAAMSAGSSFPPEPINVAALTPDELKSGSGWLIEDAVICDQYGYTEEDGSIKSIECAVAFEVKTDARLTLKGGQWAVVSMKVPVTSMIHHDIKAYLDDDTQYIGDLRMPLAVTTGTLSSTFKNYLTEYTAEYFPEEDGYVTVPIELTYRGSTAEEYVDKIADVKRTDTIMGIIFAAVGALMIGFSIVVLRREKEKAREQAAAQQAAFAAANAIDSNTDNTTDNTTTGI